jgi:hypothetical protein
MLSSRSAGPTAARASMPTARMNITAIGAFEAGAE